MAGRTFYKAADGSLTPAGKARAYNAELRRRARGGALLVGESNFGTAGKDTGDIAYGDADGEVQNGDTIAVKNEDGTITRTKVTAANRDELLNTRKGTMNPSVGEISGYGPYQPDRKVGGRTIKRYDSSKKGDKVSTGGVKGSRKIKTPDSFNRADGPTVRQRQKILQGKPLVSKKQKANSARRKASKIKTAATRKKLKVSRDKARVKTRATNARLRQRKADGIKKRREKRETKKFNKEQRKDAKRARKEAKKARRSTTDATATKVKKKVEKKAPKAPKNTPKAPKGPSFEERQRNDRERIDKEMAVIKEQRLKQEKLKKDTNDSAREAMRRINERRRQQGK